MLLFCWGANESFGVVFFLLVPFDVNWNLCQNRFEIRPIWEYHEYNSKCYAHTQCVYYVSLNRNPHQSINKTSLTHSHSSSAECRALFLFIVCLVGVFFVESSPFVRSLLFTTSPVVPFRMVDMTLCSFEKRCAILCVNITGIYSHY